MKQNINTSKILYILAKLNGILNCTKASGFNELFSYEHYFKKPSNHNNRNINHKKHDNKYSKLIKLNNEIANCKKCNLFYNRKKIVFGEGKPNSRLIFIGEGPGREEDLSGRPFVGAAGKLLDRIIKAMGLNRKDIYICNIVKCRPPGNRNPNEKEVKKCIGYLKEQIKIISPKVICLLGSVALKSFFNRNASISKMRGNFIKVKGINNVKIISTYHPAYLLRNPNAKKYVWSDVKKIIKILQ